MRKQIVLMQNLCDIEFGVKVFDCALPIRGQDIMREIEKQKILK